MREKLESDGTKDGFEKLQPPLPNVDNDFRKVKIEKRWIFMELDDTKVPQWCQGKVPR